MSWTAATRTATPAIPLRGVGVKITDCLLTAVVAKHHPEESIPVVVSYIVPFSLLASLGNRLRFIFAPMTCTCRQDRLQGALQIAPPGSRVRVVANRRAISSRSISIHSPRQRAEVINGGLNLDCQTRDLSLVFLAALSITLR